MLSKRVIRRFAEREWEQGWTLKKALKRRGRARYDQVERDTSGVLIGLTSPSFRFNSACRKYGSKAVVMTKTMMCASLDRTIGLRR